MGLVSYTGRAREGQTGCEATEWESETSMRCMVGHGARGTRRAVMTVGERGGSVSQAWSIEAPGLSIMTRLNAAGTGSTSVTVHGASMGLVSYTGRAREGQTGCEATEWESETSMRCMVGHGARGTRRVVMTVGERGGSVSQAWSIEAPGLSIMTRLNAAGTGSTSVTVHGASMGLVSYTGRAREGQTGCEATEWESETSMRCMVGHGARGTRRVVMTVGERGGSVSQAWSIEAPGLSIMTRLNAAGTGSTSVTVHGASMGLVSYTGRAREGQTGCEATEWESETSMRCMVGHGARGTRRVVMTVGERGGSVSQAWSIEAPGLSITRRGNRAGTGSTSVTVHGASMGLVSYTGRAREGQTGCEATEWESETSMRCMVGHGARGTRRAVMTVGERGGSVSQAWSIEAPGLSIMTRLNAAGTGSTSVTVHGASMGLVSYTGRAREGQTGCEATEWESETSMRCMVGHGARGTRRVVMTVGERGGSVSQAWSIEAPGLSIMTRLNAAGTGSTSVTVHGASMGLVSYTGRAREGQTGCEATEWESETSMRCMVGHGARGTRRVVMTVGERGGSVSQAWSIEAPGLSIMTRLNAAGTGSTSVTVHGASMGLVSYTGRAREGQTGCEATEWESETSMRCMVGHGARGTRRVVMTVGERGGSVSQAWSIEAPGLSIMTRLNAAGTGSTSVTVHGASMGLVSYTGRAREGQTGCEATEWESETSMRCMVGHGARGTRRVVMTVGERGGSVSQAWSIEAPGLSIMTRRGNASWDGIDIGDGAWSQHGAGVVHGTGEGGSDRMRGDRVGVGDVDEVHGGARGSRHASGGDDGRGAGRERESGMVDRGTWPEHHDSIERSWDGIDIGDGAWSQHGAGVVHGTGEGGSDRMRGDRVGVGDVDEVHGGARGSRHASGGDDGGGAGRERESGMVDRGTWPEHHDSIERSWDGIDIGDGAWSQHGAGVVHGTGEGGSDRMRGDRVGVGDVDEVHGGARGSRHASGGDDGRGAGRERESGMVDRGTWPEHHDSIERSWDGIDIGDGAWSQHGAGVVHGTGEGGSDRMRGDRVGVGDVDEVHGGARGSRHASGGDDGRGAGRERESGMVDRGTWPEHHAKGQPSWDGIDIGDGAWSQHGAGVVHGTGEGGSDRMRGDRVGVGDVDEVHGGARGSRHASGGDDGRGAGRERESGMVDRGTWPEHHD